MASRRFISTLVSAAPPQLSKITTISTAAPSDFQTRTLSSNGSMAFDRLREALESYRQKHYTQELPTRFKKDVVKAAAIRQDDMEQIALEGLQKVVFNIEAHHQVSRQDVELIFREFCGDEGYIPAERMLRML
jgi:hypothetical protein